MLFKVVLNGVAEKLWNAKLLSKQFVSFNFYFHIKNNEILNSSDG